MKIIKITFLSLSVLLICSCFQKQSDKIEVTPIVFNLSAALSYDTLETHFLLSYPMGIILTDNYLIIQDERGHHYNYHVLDKKTGNLCFEFGEKGQGPIEMLAPTWNPYYDPKNKIIQMFDVNKKAIFYNSIQDNKTNSESILKLSLKYNLFFREFFDLNDFYLTLGMNGFFTENQFVTFDKSFEMIDKFGQYPVLDDDRETNEIMNKDVYTTCFYKISPNLKHIAFASYKVGLLEIFETDKLPYGITKKRAILLAPPYKQTKSTENIFGFEDVFVTDNYIYTLYNGKTAKENQGFTQRIKIFNWEGKPIIDYYLGIDMRCLAVDEKEKVIYAVAYTEEMDFFLIKTDIIDYI